VDPLDPDALYVRTDLWAYDATAGVARARDALLYSSDGGRSFSELLRAGAKLLGFSFSPDGTELMVGYGDPLELGGARLVDPDALGIYRAPKGSSKFRKLYAGSVGCLTWSDRGLYVCTHEADTAFSLGLARDTSFDADAPPSFQPLLVLADVVGPLTCEACDSGAVCPSYWEATCQTFGRDDCTALPARADRCESEGGGAGGNAANVDGGAPAEAGRVGETRALGGGCGCRLARSKSAQSVWGLLALLLMLVRRATRTGSVACRG
jgi:hypothetical protein